MADSQSSTSEGQERALKERLGYRAYEIYLTALVAFINKIPHAPASMT